MTFLQKFYGEYTKVEKPVLVTTSYEGSNDDEELETVLVINNNNNVNIVSDSDSDNSDNSDDVLKMTMKTFLMKMSMMKSMQPPKPLSMQRWYMQ